MDSFFGIGLPELILILIIAGIVMGPERIGQTARWLGKTTAQMRAISQGFIRQFNAEIGAADESGELKNAWQDVQDLRQQLDALKSEFTTVAKKTMHETKQAVDESKQVFDDTRKEFENTIMPPGMNGRKSTKNRQESQTQNTKQPSVTNDPPLPLTLPKRIEIADDPD